jgi:putative zinc finger protein
MDDAFTSRLSEYLDDEDLDPRERREIDAHVRSCAACRTLLDELREVRSRAQALPNVPPETDLWPGIAERVGASRSSERVVSFPARTARRISFTIPQFIAASLAMMVVSGGMVWLMRAGGPRTDVGSIAAVERPRTPDMKPANFADPQYDQAVADLERTLQVGRGRLDPETIRVLEANLQAIDRAIEQSRQALEADPANLFLNAHLATARQRKLALLRQASALAGPESSS